MTYSAEVDKVLIERDFFIEHRKRTDHRMDRPHFHDGYEIQLTLNDNTHYFIDERQYISNAGSVAVLNSQEIHRVAIKEGVMYESYYILFKPHYLEFAISEYSVLFSLFIRRFEGFENVVQLNEKDHLHLVHLFDELVELQNNQLVSINQLKIKLKLLEIILFLHDYYAQGNQFKKRIAYDRSDELKAVLDFIKVHYAKSIKLDDLVRTFYISKSTLIRLFKLHLGMTPNEYISYIRFIEARKLLKQGYQIKIVATMVGYGDDSTFIKKFKKISGISPKQYALNNSQLTYID